MLGLVLSNGDKVSTVAQDVSRHEYWVGVETESSPLITFASLLFLKLDHLVEPAEWSQARKEPHHLSVSVNMTLHKYFTLCGVQATGN